MSFYEKSLSFLVLVVMTVMTHVRIGLMVL